MDPDLIKLARALYKQAKIELLKRLGAGRLPGQIAKARYSGGAMTPEQIAIVAKRTGGDPLKEVHRLGRLTKQFKPVDKVPLTPAQSMQGGKMVDMVRRLAPRMAKKNRIELITAQARNAPRKVPGKLVHLRL